MKARIGIILSDDDKIHSAMELKGVSLNDCSVLVVQLLDLADDLRKHASKLLKKKSRGK